MAAKTAGTWQSIVEIGIGDLTVTGTTQLHTLGKRIVARDSGSTAYGHGEFIYLKGVASTVRGSVVLIKDDFTTSLVTARDKGALAVALSANVASQYGWYQIKGQGVAACDTTAANAPLYIDGTDGRVDDAVVAGDQIIGMRSVSADDTSTCVVMMGVNPATADFDNA
jgi:hypothetical protein